MSSLAGAGGRVVTGGAALVVDQSGTTSFAGAISGSGGFTKRGSGALALTGSHTFTGVTLVEGGRIDLGVGRINVAPGGIAPEALVIDILAGRDGNPAGAWTGSTGITSSVAALAVATGGSPRAVGWIDNGVGGLRWPSRPRETRTSTS
jgi:fibronectin-binding autotransporter adhesin